MDDRVWCPSRDVQVCDGVRGSGGGVTYPVDEQVLRLEVPVQDVAAVAEGESLQQLVHERLRHNTQLGNATPP